MTEELSVATASRERRDWMSVLAKAAPEAVAEAWRRITPPSYVSLRPPEVGLVLVRARMGGLGDAFNLGEMTVTRATVRLDTGETGLAYVAGRDRAHAEVAAVLDAMLQAERHREAVEREVIAPLRRVMDAQRESEARKAAATRVDFFTMVRDREPSK